MFERTFVGLDVHAQSISACALTSSTGVVLRDKLAADPVSALSWIQRLDLPVQAVGCSGDFGQWYPMK